MSNDLLQGVDVVRVRRGVMYLAGDPIFIFEHRMYNGDDVDYVACFKVDTERYEKSKETVIEKKRHVVKGKSYNENSVLGRLANEKLKKQPKKVYVEYEPAIYVATVEHGVSTLTDKEGLGFYERTADRVDLITGKMERGKRTGVFISMDDIYWDEATIDTDSLLRSLTKKGDEWYEV